MTARALGIVSAVAAVLSAIFTYWQASVASRAQQSTLEAIELSRDALELAEAGMVFPHKISACMHFSETMFHVVDSLNRLEHFATEALAQGSPTRDRIMEVEERYRTAILNYNLANLSFQIANGAGQLDFAVLNLHSPTRGDAVISEDRLEEDVKRDLLQLRDEARSLRDDSSSILQDAAAICSRMISEPALAAN